MNPSSGARVLPDAGRLQGFPPGNLSIDTCSTPGFLHHFRTEASDPSARLTPSPHCSRATSPGPAIGPSDEARASQSRAAAQDPLGQFRYDPARQAIFPSVWGVGLPGGLALWPVNFRATLGSSESRWAFARRGPASSPAATGVAHQLQGIRGDAGNDGVNGSPRRAGASAQALGESGPFAQMPRSHAGGAPLWQSSFAKQPIAPGRDGDQLFDPGPEWRTTARPVSQTTAARQLQATLPRTRTQRPLSATAAEDTQQSQSTGFQPMMAVAEPERRRNSLAAMQLQSQDSNKFSSRYHGMHTENNASAEYLVPGQNCALWLTNLPADVEYSELLGAISQIGRVWCTYINLPDNVKHHTAAAKVVFFTPEAAQKLLTNSWTKTIVIRGCRVRASHNRIKYGRNAMAGKMSRVLIITGSQEFVNPENLRNWFMERFVFQEDVVIELIKAAGRAVCEFRFGSYRCQAQMGKMALEKDRPVGFEKVEFADDPCEVGENLASYGIAAERIQGKGL
ncbi:hypothetical protein HRG_001058 [Hirsutella rhossiliensis]|uniref:RRM domain-containing protein n=1 Tax=Hirsutella rhossiliensis TaxID=111463 RepID=A0A9P8SMV9_9HYPO|nr:uncharacterized protein HRG_01058 [Hirsutella rhossiliensis]KAH0968416.1 hypothetical protein HRG_01058 [Hirsutella rhossiliensis]